MFGIAIGVSALIIVMSIFNGFGDFTINELVKKNAHLSISNPFKEIEEEVKKLNGFDKMYLSYSTNALVEFSTNKINTTIIYSDEFTSNIVSNDIVSKLEIFSGDTLKVISMEQLEAMLTSFNFPLINKLVVDRISYDNQGLIKTNDKKMIFSSSKKTMNIYLKDYEKSEVMKEYLLKKYPNITIETWQSKNKLLLVIMQIEKYFVFLVLFIIVIIASFNLFASLSMTIFEKSQDIGILRTIGTNSSQIKKIFISQGFISGVVGLVLGIIIGLSIVLSQIYFSWININVSNGISHPLPVDLELINIAFIILFTLIIIFLSSYYPAKFSTKKSIPESIKLNF